MMNNKIFELAKQADLIQWDTLPSGARTPDHESVAKAMKFAELIVQECVYVLGENISPLQMKSFLDEYPERIPMSSKELQDRRRNGQIEGLLMGAKAIEKHFGVEE